MMRGCENPVPDLQAPFSEHGVVGQVLETGELLSLTDHPSVSEGRKGGSLTSDSAINWNTVSGAGGT
ncbi:MAG: hypothetical protein CM1200mP25_1430 [Acidobacteriota bacterium]|nr:MAG: hypothetical protein CM1200mP25_1430 [Acidobacteriota bacterium]